jgi:2-polyprenyl-3-methyl-5-hydroxy-6-metoxy-1,4-benzoquinol methylase
MELSILSVPCGIPRDLADGAAIARQRGADLRNVAFHGLDLDPEVLHKAARFAEENGLANFHIHEGDALARNSYPSVADFVSSTGLAEFLDDRRLEMFYRVIFEAIRPGGAFVSSGMQRRSVSEYLLKIAELRVNYRSTERLEEMARAAGFQKVTVRYDEFEIQSILVARK